VNGSGEEMAIVTEPMMISGLHQIADDYDGYLVDLWGCVHDGIEPYPAAVKTLLKLIEMGKTVCLLSNGPRRGVDLVARLDQMGVPRTAYHHVMSSGEAAWQAFADRADAFHAELGTRCYHLGPPRDVSVMHNNGLTQASTIATADFILCTGPIDYSHIVEAYEQLLVEAHERGLPMVCANPDLVVHIGPDLVMCAGLIARRYEEMGGTVVYHGKPYASVYKRCFELLTTLSTNRIIGVGDGLRTDVLGAARHGLASLFLTAGIHTEEVGGMAPEMDRIVQLADEVGARPTFFMPQLAW
jgi:HAD superfamily hydrolase (TIGR01459 family)